MKLTGLFVALTAAASLVGSDMAFAAKAPLELKPSSTWFVNYDEDSCRMLRQFGEGEGKVTLVFDRFAPSESFLLTLGGQPVKTRSAGKVSIQFGPDEEEHKMGFFIGSFGKAEPAMLFHVQTRIGKATAAEMARQANEEWPEYFEYQAIGPEREKAVTYLRIGSPLRIPIILQTGSMGPPLAAFSKCADGLLELWGLDANRHQNLKSKVMPTSNPGDWIRSEDYPKNMLFEGQQSLIQFRLLVDESGKPTTCHIQQTARPKEFDDAVCGSLMKRAKFSPAIDSDGNAIKSYWQTSVRFILP